MTQIINNRRHDLGQCFHLDIVDIVRDSKNHFSVVKLYNKSGILLNSTTVKTEDADGRRVLDALGSDLLKKRRAIAN